MKRFSLLVVIAVVLIAAVSSAHATTFVKVNGLTSGTITNGTPFILTMDCASGSDVIVLASGSLNGMTANYGAMLVARDNGFDDENSTAGLIQRTMKPDLQNYPPGEVLTLTAYEPSSGTSATCTATVQATTTSQGLQGTVYNFDGSPAVNAVVVARCESTNVGGDINTGSAVTDSSGDYTIDLPTQPGGSGSYDLTVFQDLQSQESWSFNPLYLYHIVVSNGAMATVPNINLPHNWVILREPYNSVIKGKVTDDSSHPLPGVQIHGTVTDISGNFEIHANAGDSITPTLANYVSDSDYTVSAGGVTTQNMTMHHGTVEMQFTVQDSVGSAAIPYMATYISGTNLAYSETANAGGLVSFWLDPSQTYNATFQDNWGAFVPYENSYLTAASGASPFTVSLSPLTAIVSGQIKDNNSNPVPYATASWLSNTNGTNSTVTADASGNYSFEAYPGSYSITFSTLSGWNAKTDNSYTVSAGTNTLNPTMTYLYTPPTLSGLKETPVKGTTRTTFEVDAVYTDSLGNAPNSVFFYVNGVQYVMTKNDTSSDYATGVKFSCFTKLPAGVWGIQVQAVSNNTKVDAVRASGQPQVLRTAVDLGRIRTSYFGSVPIGSVIGINGAGNIWENTYGVWTGILPGTFTKVVPADLNGTGIDNAVALDSSGAVNMYANGAWTQKGRLTSLVVGDFAGDGRDGIAGINSNGQIWVYDDGAWTEIPGQLKEIWTGDFFGTGTDGLVGINAAGQIWFTPNLFPTTPPVTWTQVSGNLSGLVVGDFTGIGQDGIAGLNSGDEIWYNMDMASPTWTQVPGNLQKICAGDFLGTGQDGLVGINSNDQIWLTEEVTPGNVSWNQISGNLRSVITGDFSGSGPDQIAGLNSLNQIWVFNGVSWSQLPGNLTVLGGKQPMYVLP